MARKMIKKALRISRELNAPDRKWLAAEVRKMLLSNEAGTSILRSASARLPKRSAKVFISHSHKDRAFVRALVHRLEDAGIKVWLHALSSAEKHALPGRANYSTILMSFYTVIVTS